MTPHAEPDATLVDSERILNIALKSIGILAVLAARVGMVNVCISSAETITKQTIHDPEALTIGITNTLGSVLGSGLISILSTDYLVDAITRKLSADEEELLQSSLSQCSRCAISTISVVAGILSQIPMAMGAYFATVPPIPASFNATSQMADFARSAYSIHHRLTEFLIAPSRCSRTPTTTALLSLKEQLLMAIQQVNHSQGSIPDEIKNMIKDSNSGQELLDKILVRYENKSAPFHHNLLNALAYTIGCVLIAEYFMIAFVGAKRFSNDSLPISITAGVLTALANADLLLRLTASGASHLRELISGRQPSLLQNLSPDWHYGLTAFGMIVSLLPWAPSIYFAKEYFPSPAQMPVGIISAIAIMLCSLSATFTFRDRIITKIQTTDPSVKLQGQLNKISHVIRQTSLAQIQTLYHSLSDEAKQHILPDPLTRALLERTATQTSQLEMPSSYDPV